ncbi:hypothetical protein P7H25_02370 [Paenibacillus larvae]|nr:hypothetical protein [Paenibacillus larvae]MDT2254723.1 hypothetical protein [Paenibacillus larvae]
MSNRNKIKNRQVGMTMDKHTELAKVTAAMQQTKEAECMNFQTRSICI